MGMDLLEAPLRTAEFLAVDVETNGCAGDACELTEVGAVLVGGGELHERFESLVAVARAAVARDPALHRHLAGDGRRGAAGRGVLPEPGRAAARARARGSQRGLRPARAAPGVRARGHRSGPTRRCCAPSRWPGASPRSCAGARCGRSPGRWASRWRGRTAPWPTPRPARGSSARSSRLCAHAARSGDAVALLRPPAPAPGARAPARRRGQGRADAASGPTSPGCPTGPASTSSATRRGGRCTSASRSPCAPRALALRAAAAEHRPGRSRREIVEPRRRSPSWGRCVLENRLIKRLRPPGNVAPQERRRLRLPALPPRHPLPGARGGA